MRRSMYSACAVLALTGFALQARGQATTAPAKSKGVPPKFQVYTAEFKGTLVQTLANGTAVTSESFTTQARDSQGRSVMATTQQQEEQASFTTVHVDDPVTGTQMDWSSDRKKVTIVKLPPTDERHGCWSSAATHLTIHYNPKSWSVKAISPAPPGSSGQDMTVYEDLGVLTILSIEAHGRRSTETTPAGAAGNDQPLITITENWTADGYPFQLRNTMDDPSHGREERELVKLDRGEPDPALFQPPEGYQIVTDELVPCKE